MDILSAIIWTTDIIGGAAVKLLAAEVSLLLMDGYHKVFSPQDRTAGYAWLRAEFLSSTPSLVVRYSSQVNTEFSSGKKNGWKRNIPQ